MTAPTKCVRKFVCDRCTTGTSTLQRMTNHNPSNPSPLRRQPYPINFAWNCRLVSGLIRGPPKLHVTLHIASLYLSKGWQMSDAMPDAEGGEGGHGAAKPERVIHRT